MKHNYTEEQRAFLREQYPKLNRRELSAQFNAQFGTSLSVEAITGSCKRYGIKSGRTGRFQKSCTPHNKGNHNFRVSIRTEFRKGRKPHNYLPVGSERVNTYGYHDIKVADPNKWRAKHALMWEEKNGPIPPGHVVIFIDGDKNNLDHDNFALVKRAELARLNKTGFSQQLNEFRETHLAIVRVEVKAHELQRGRNRG